MARHNKHTAIAHEALPSVAGGRRAGGESLATRHKEAPLAATSPPPPTPAAPALAAEPCTLCRLRYDRTGGGSISIFSGSKQMLCPYEKLISSICIRNLIFMCHYVFSSHLLTVILINQSVNLIKAKLQSQCLASSTESNKREN